MPTVLQKGNTFYAQKGSYFEGNVKIDGDFIVPAHTHFWGRLTVTMLPDGSASTQITAQVPVEGTTTAIGNGLLSKWLLPFEITSVVLIATMIGAIVIARKEVKPD